MTSLVSSFTTNGVARRIFLGRRCRI